MIFSSSDIASLIGGDPIIKAVCDIEVVDARPALKAGSGVVIYIKRYPELSEFEAKWDIWIIDYDNEPVDIVIRQLRKLLPQFTILEEGAIIKASTTELRAEKTESEVKVEPVLPQKDPYEEKFQDLIQSIEDRMLLVGPGRPGRDGKDGRDGAPGRSGRDGRDLVATDAELNDLKDVFVPDPDRGQFLMFDGASWIARYVPQIFSGGGGGSSGGNGSGTSMPEPPSDGRFYLRQVNNGAGQWIDLLTAINSLYLDGGDFDGLRIKGERSILNVNGSQSYLRLSRSLMGETENIVVDGLGASLLFDRTLNGEADNFVTTGSEAFMLISRKINIDTGNFVLSGQPADIIPPPPTVFNSLTYSGNDVDATSITGANFKPGFVLIKSYSGPSGQGPTFYDRVRGATKYWIPGDTQQITSTLSLQSFDANGFTLGSGIFVNGSGYGYKAFCWKEGSTPATNNSGSIQSTVSVSEAGDHSIFTWTGNSTTSTIGHGLGAIPELLIFKVLANGGIAATAAAPAVGDNYYIPLSTTSARVSSADYYKTATTSTVNLGFRINSVGAVVGYAFRSIDRVSKVGTFTSDGLSTYSVNCGFRPEIVIAKSYIGTSDWTIYYRPSGGTGYASFVSINSNANEAVSSKVQITNFGFTVDSGGIGNASGGASSAIFLAYA